jgi:molecular chaperone GrpE
MARKANEQDKKTDIGEKSVDDMVETSSQDTAEDALKKAEKEAAEHYDKFLRISAEFENYKKRSAKDRADLAKYANEQLIRDILPIMDSMERALEHVSSSDDINAFVEGLKLIQEKLSMTLEKNGVEIIETADQNFDPNYHEAMLQVDTDEPDADNKIAEVFETGYLLNGRLLRPAKVSIFKHSEEKKL